MQQHARHFAGFHDFLSDRITTIGACACFGLRHHQRGRATETRGTLGIRNVGDLREQQRVVGFVIAMLARPTCGKNAGGIAHHVHNQTGIVGDCRAARTCGHITGLEQRVLLEGHAIFHRIRQIQRTGRHQLHLICVRTQAIFQNAVDFNEFALVMRCDDDSHVPIPFVAVRCFVDVGLPDVRLTCPDLPNLRLVCEASLRSAYVRLAAFSPVRARTAVRPAVPCCPFPPGQAARSTRRG